MNRMSDDLISREAAIALVYKLGYINVSNQYDFKANCRVDKIRQELVELPTAFDKEKVIEELKSWEKASHDAGIQSTYAELDNKASGYYQESRAYHRAIEIVEKGGIE